MKGKKKLILVGDSFFAEVAFEYFTYDSDFEVEAFAVERAFLKREVLFEKPVIALEEIRKLFSVSEYFFYVAIPYTQLNRLRTRLYQQLKGWGYRPASYLSSKSFIWRNVQIGEHCFVFENNILQPFSSLGDNVVLWSGNHLGHHSRIGSHSFISSQVVISGNVCIGDSCFLGVNSTVVNDLEIADDVVIGAGALVTSSITSGSFLKSEAARASSRTAFEFFALPGAPRE